MRRMPSGWTPDPAGPSVPRMTRCGHFSCSAIFAAAMATRSLPLCTISIARPERSHSSQTWASGSEVWPPLMWPMTSASASSTTSLSIRPEPGMEGPPVWIVLWMPYLRAQATIGAASLPAFTEPSPISPSSLTPASARSLKSCSTMPLLDHRRAGEHLDAAGPEIVERALGRDGQRLQADDVLGPAREVHLAGGNHRRHAAVHRGIDPSQLVLARRPVAEHGMNVAVDQAGRDGCLPRVDEGARAFRRRSRPPCRTR